MAEESFLFVSGYQYPGVGGRFFGVSALHGLHSEVHSADASVPDIGCDCFICYRRCGIAFLGGRSLVADVFILYCFRAGRCCVHNRVAASWRMRLPCAGSCRTFPASVKSIACR